MKTFTSKNDVILAVPPEATEPPGPPDQYPPGPPNSIPERDAEEADEEEARYILSADGDTAEAAERWHYANNRFRP